MVYIKLFFEFLKVGLFSFGGAYSGIPLIRDVVLRNNWCSEDTFINIIAISESTPGSIIVNLATYIGSIQAGFLGSIIATIAVITPAFIFIIILTQFFSKYCNKAIVQKIFSVIRASIIAVIFATGIHLLYEQIISEYSENILSLNKEFLFNSQNYFIQKLIILFILLLVLIWTKIKKIKINTIAFILFCAIISIVVCAIYK